MEDILDILLDSVLDAVKILPFLFIAFLLIEFIEHKLGDKAKNIVSKSGKVGPLVGGLLGGIPQCGFSVVATNLYVTRLITLGTLIAIYLSTSDEMIPVLLSNSYPIQNILLIVAIKIVTGIMFGFIIDIIYRKKKKIDVSMCEDCDCDESILKGSLEHTFKTIVSIFLIILVLNILFFYLDEELIDTIFMKSSILAPFVSGLIGLIPNCGSSVLISELYVKGVIHFGSLIAGLMANSGLGLLILFRSNKKHMKENISIVLLVYIISVVTGLVFWLLGVSV